MTLFEKLISAFSGGKENRNDLSKRLHIIDTTQLAGSNGGRDSRSPRDRFKMLQKLSRFIDREKMAAIAVMDGRPLNEAPEGSEYNTVRVYYAPKTSDIPDRAFDLFKQYKRRHAVIVITADRKLEELTERAGGSVMRTSTLRKAMENGGGSGNRPRSSRRNRRPRPRKAERSQQAPNQTGERRDASGPNTGVSDLIDLVD